MDVCPFCNTIVAPFDPHKRRIPQTTLVCHDYCQDEAMHNAAKEKPHEHLPSVQDQGQRLDDGRRQNRMH